MNRRAWTFVISVAVIALLGAGYLYLSSRPEPAAPAVKSPTIQLWKFDKEQLAKVVLSGRAEDTLIVEKMGGEWRTNYPYPIQLNKFAIEQLQYNFADMEAERIVEENPVDLSKYGLQPPRAVAEASLDDGTVRTFFIGDASPTGETYYLQEKGDARVYSVWKSLNEQFHITVSSLREKKITPGIYSDEITYLLLRQRDGTEFEIRSKTKEESADYTLGSGKYLITKPYRYLRGVDRDKSVSFMRGTAAVDIASFVDDAPKDLSQYGLDRPQAEVIVRDNAVSLHFQFGGETKSGEEVYFKIVGNPSVYTVDRLKLIYLSVKPFDILDRRVLSAEVDDVDRIEIVSEGEAHVFTIERTQNEAGEVFATYKGDGRDLTEQSFIQFYDILRALAVDGEATGQKAGTPVARTRFLLNKGTIRDVSVDYMPYNRDFRAVFVGGKSEFAMSTIQLDSMLGALKRLLAGDKVNP